MKFEKIDTLFDPNWKRCVARATFLVEDEVEIKRIRTNPRADFEPRLKSCGMPSVDITRELAWLEAMSDGVNKKSSAESLAIKQVIFNNPATIVIWKDGTKTVVKRQKGERWDKEKGLAMAIAKKVFGNKGAYCNQFKKWIDETEVKK